MRRVEADALVGASREEVWELLDDIAAMPRWLPGVRAISSVSGPARVGTIYREETAIAGVARHRTWEITEHRRPLRQVRLALDAAMERVLILTLDGRGTGTRLHAAVELRSTLPIGIRLLHEIVAMPGAAAGVGALVTAAKRAFEGSAPR
jgi:hypothetical protein